MYNLCALGCLSLNRNNKNLIYLFGFIYRVKYIVTIFAVHCVQIYRYSREALTLNVAIKVIEIL